MAGKFAVVGCQHGHIGSFIGGMLELGWTFEAIVDDGDPWLSAKLSDEHGVEVIPDRDGFLAKCESEIIGVASVNKTKGADIAACLSAGKNTISDKPLAVTVEDLALIEAAHKESGKQSVAMLTMRYSPLVRAAKAVVDSGEIGEIVSCIGLAPHRLSPDSRPAWMFDDELYGGVTVDIACHSVDLFLWFAGKAVDEVYCHEWTTRHKDSHPGITDISTSLIRLEGGASGFFRPDWMTPDKFPKHGDYRFSVIGTKGKVELCLAGMPGEFGDAGGLYYSDTTEPVMLEPVQPGKGLIAEFVDHATSGADTSLTTTESIRAHQAVALCRRSAKEGRPLKWGDVIGS